MVPIRQKFPGPEIKDVAAEIKQLFEDSYQDGKKYEAYVSKAIALVGEAKPAGGHVRRREPLRGSTLAASSLLEWV